MLLVTFQRTLSGETHFTGKLFFICVLPPNWIKYATITAKYQKVQYLGPVKKVFKNNWETCRASYILISSPV